MTQSGLVKKVPWHTWVRWSLAILLIIGGIVVALCSTTGHGFQVCEDQIARVGSQSSVRICRSLSVIDAPVLLGLLLFVMLILPDFTKVSILGFLELERKVATQEDKTRALESQVVALQTVQASASARIVQYLRQSDEPGSALSDLDHKAAELFLRSSDDPDSAVRSVHNKKERLDG